MDFFAHPQSIVEADVQIGARTRVWAFAHVLPGARIGADCNICDHVFIEGDVRIGDRTTVKCGVQLWNGVRVGNDVFIGPNATFTNDRFPRSRKHLPQYPETVLGDGCSIGANATVLPGVVIGRNAMVGAGAVVTRSVPPNAVVAGNPAEIVGYENTPPVVAPTPVTEGHEGPAVVASKVRGVTFHRMPLIHDMRGNLSVGEFSRSVPFFPKRYFMVFGVTSREIRGEHAHRRCAQFLICTAGSCRVVADDGKTRDQFVLDDPTKALYVPPMTWTTQYKYTANALLLVFASDHYDPEDYIRDYDEFSRIASAPGS